AREHGHGGPDPRAGRGAHCRVRHPWRAARAGRSLRGDEFAVPRGAGMRDVLRLLRLFGQDWRWGLAGIGLSIGVILANVGLLALAGWFITMMGPGGLG